MKKFFIFIFIFLFASFVFASTYTIDVPSSGSNNPSGGSSTTGGSTSGSVLGTYSVSATQFISGYEKELSLNNRFKITIDNELYYVKLINVTENMVIINVSGNNTQQATLSLGDFKNFDVNGDNNYDLSVTLNFINETANKASLMVKSVSGKVIDESVPVEDGAKEGLEEKKVDSRIKDVRGKILRYLIFGVMIIFIIIGFIIFIIKKKDNSGDKKEEDKKSKK